MATASPSFFVAAPDVRARVRGGARSWTARPPTRRHTHVAPLAAVPQDADGRKSTSDKSDDQIASGLLSGGSTRSLKDVLASASAATNDPDVVVEALGMRVNLLDAADELRARQRAMDNLGSLMASGNANALNSIPPDLLPMLLRLPSTSGNVDSLRTCADGINEWKSSLQKGLLPGAETKWPDDLVFREALLDALGDLDMARFTRQFPPVLDTLMKNILDILYIYEQQKEDDSGEGESEDSSPEMKSDAGGGGEDGDGDPEDGDPDSGGGEGGGDGEDSDSDSSDGSSAGGGGSSDGKCDGDGSKTDIAEIDMNMESDAGDGDDAAAAAKEAAKEAARERNKDLMSKLMDDFKADWEPAVDKLDKAAKAFEGLDLDDLNEGPDGFDVTKGLWRQTGWKELDSLRKKLEELRELRDLVRSLGRGAGRGPLKRAPRQRERPGMPIGLVRSPLEPEETNGLCRSDDISRMLPSELALIANGTRPARLLHFARRMERTLLSYERVGWSEEPAVTVEGSEIRPAAECGPIILCLDTSGSMMGARETVAKAMVVECMRQAKSQQRQCYLYSFSGPGDCVELELKVTGKGVAALLEFLSGSFHGGTDVDEPFIRALQRLEEQEWSNADILLVTDGEIRPPDTQMLADLNNAKETMGLKVRISHPTRSASLLGPITTTVYSYTLRETDTFLLIVSRCTGFWWANRAPARTWWSNSAPTRTRLNPGPRSRKPGGRGLVRALCAVFKSHEHVIINHPTWN